MAYTCEVGTISPTLGTRTPSPATAHHIGKRHSRLEFTVRNVPNILTLSRLLATIPLVALVLIDQPTAYLIATAIFAAGAITDTLDGQLARKYHLVSRLGVFLDLTADKVFVSALLIALVQVQIVPAWIA